MFYVQQNGKIVLFDTNKVKIQNTLAMSQYVDLPIFETEREIIELNNEFVFKDEVQDKLTQAREEEFLKRFLATPLGNFRLQPKGYANAQQAMDVINTMAMALGGLTEQLTNLVIFYETPDFTKEEQCTEEWLVAHQIKPDVMTLEQWQKFYFEFCQLYAMQQYKTTA